MKILSLRLKNLNSLKGEWKIDFTAEPFASNGLFAITGATGAGKPPCSTPSAWRFITKRRA
jgi:exonuclease SbcC